MSGKTISKTNDDKKTHIVNELKAILYTSIYTKLIQHNCIRNDDYPNICIKCGFPIWKKPPNK